MLSLDVACLLKAWPQRPVLRGNKQIAHYKSITELRLIFTLLLYFLEVLKIITMQKHVFVLEQDGLSLMRMFVIDSTIVAACCW